MSQIKSVAIIGAGASGAAAASALTAETVFDRIQVFERRETAGGTWIYDPDPGAPLPLSPGSLPPIIDPPSKIPQSLPASTPHSNRERYDRTPIYESLTSVYPMACSPLHFLSCTKELKQTDGMNSTNVPDIAMSFSDLPFAYGPFVPHWVPKQYIENYFSAHHIDKYLVTNTTVEDVFKLKNTPNDAPRWSLTLRRFNAVTQEDKWLSETFDAVVIANGHYSVPYVPKVSGLEEYITKHPGRVIHSKEFRSAKDFSDKKVLIIGNSSSGQDLVTAIREEAAHPVYQSRRSPGRWDGDAPPPGVEWKPMITEYHSSGKILFSDGSVLDQDEVDSIIYCTGYKPSFPFWNVEKNGQELYNYRTNRLIGNYLHTFLHEIPSIAIIGLPRVLTFRSMEYQAIAVARVWSGRRSLPCLEERKQWERDRVELTNREGRKFHDVPWDNGDTCQYLQALFDIAGLPTLDGAGRFPPVIDAETRWAIENVKKYPEPHKADEQDGFVVVTSSQTKDRLHFI